MNKVTAARAQFLTWLQREAPDLYAQALQYADGSGMGAEEAPTSFWGKLTEGLTTLATGVIALKSQKAILDTNIARANQGLPPISMSEGAPVVRTEIDVSPEIASRLQASAVEGTHKLLLWGGLAALAVFMMRGKRR